LAKPALLANKVTLNSGLIYDPGRYVKIDLLILKPTRTSIFYHAVGKVAQQESIPFVRRLAQTDKRSWPEIAFEGSFLVHVARLIGYFIVGFGLLFLLSIAMKRFSEMVRMRKAKARESVAVAAAEVLASHDPRLVQIALGIFSHLGAVPFGHLIRHLDSQYKRGDLEKPVRECAEVMGDLVHANRKSVHDHLQKWIVTSSSSIAVFLRPFDLVYIDTISSPFMAVMDDLCSFAGRVGAEKHGTGLSEFAQARLAELD
jgi:hypothetical protein